MPPEAVFRITNRPSFTTVPPVKVTSLPFSVRVAAPFLVSASAPVPPFRKIPVKVALVVWVTVSRAGPIEFSTSVFCTTAETPGLVPLRFPITVSNPRRER